jgi:hypothetical protein
MTSPVLPRGPGRLAAVTLACLAALAGGCVISAEGDIPDVEVTTHDLSFPAAPARAEGMEVGLAVPFRMTPTRLGLPRAGFALVEVLSVSLLATSGVEDLSFIRSARLTVTNPDLVAAGKASIEIGRYERPQDADIGPFLFVPSEPPADVTELWRGKQQVTFTAEVVGQLPAVRWTADVGIRFSAKLEY